MPSVEHSQLVPEAFSKVWRFVRDMDNWAPLLTGYQRHEKIDDATSIWFLKGELGGLTRVAEFKAVVTEWDESGRVTFKLEGINEPLTGSGSFVATPLVSESDSASRLSSPQGRTGLFVRIRDAFVRILFHKIFGVKRDSETSFDTKVSTAGAGQTQITFNLTLTAGGMAGVAMNLLIAPMLKPVAEDLARNIATAIQKGGIAAV
jgi:carbon monoxide dehydrogenase subunit G